MNLEVVNIKRILKFNLNDEVYNTIIIDQQDDVVSIELPPDPHLPGGHVTFGAKHLELFAHELNEAAQHARRSEEAYEERRKLSHG